MPSSMVETVREIPLIVEMNNPMETENVGFPFDDDRDDQEDAPFRSQLDDIAARHPEFAQHLGTFPFRSNNRARTQIPENFGHQRFTDRPFGDRFERFGFPFEEPFKEEEDKPYYKRYPKYYPTHNSEEGSGEHNQESQNTNSVVNEEDLQAQNSRSRRPKQNIQQSNTVDLGQRQEPVDDRNQRSMSAPPPNSRPRFVSSINIPINQTENMVNPQPSVPSQPQERVIPIHVEGRDEPVIPKKSVSQNSGQPQQQHSQQPPPHSDKFYTQRPPNFSQYFNREQPFQSEWFPRGFHTKQGQAQSNVGQSQRGRSPQPQSKPETSQQQTTNIPRPADTQQKSADQVKMDTNEPHAQDPQKPPVSSKVDPIDQIKSIQKDVSELMAQVDQFGGKPKDKLYLYLDEMLTRNLIKLDNIDTQGQENIRQARKEAIKCIEKCIGILESKANANVENISKEDKEMEVEPNTSEQDTKDVQNQEMKVDISSVNAEEKDTQENKQEPVVEKSMEIDVKNENTADENQKNVSLDTTSTITKVIEATESTDVSLEEKSKTGESSTENNEVENQQKNVDELEDKKEIGEPKKEEIVKTNETEEVLENKESEVSCSEDKKEKKKTKKKLEKK